MSNLIKHPFKFMKKQPDNDKLLKIIDENYVSLYLETDSESQMRIRAALFIALTTNFTTYKEKLSTMKEIDNLIIKFAPIEITETQQKAVIDNLQYIPLPEEILNDRQKVAIFCYIVRYHYESTNVYDHFGITDKASVDESYNKIKFLLAYNTPNLTTIEQLYATFDAFIFNNDLTPAEDYVVYIDNQDKLASTLFDVFIKNKPMPKFSSINNNTDEIPF